MIALLIFCLANRNLFIVVLTSYLLQMGLGKTIQTIGLILSTMNADNQPDTAQCVPQEQGSMRTNDPCNKKLTLIVTPLALIQQWASEIKSKTEDGKLKVLIHHGQSRTKGKKLLVTSAGH